MLVSANFYDGSSKEQMTDVFNVVVVVVGSVALGEISTVLWVMVLRSDLGVDIFRRRTCMDCRRGIDRISPGRA